MVEINPWSSTGVCQTPFVSLARKTHKFNFCPELVFCAESPVVPEASLESGSNSRLLRVLEDAVESSTSPTDHPDYVNHRHLLWEAAGLFAGVAERRNKDVVALFYRFLE